MNRLTYYFYDYRVRTLLGLLIVAGALYVSAATLKLALVWVGVAVVTIALIWAIVWWVRRRKARRHNEELGELFKEEAARAEKTAPDAKRADVALLRERMLAAVQLIKTSKLGETSGRAALYELPWYVVIGNPAAGKSSAVVNSGLKFPYSDQGGNVIQGIGGTRNCDWFFTTEGILLDTAGRYSVEAEDRQEWLGFLSLLKKHRRKAPINGIILAASIGELTECKPEHAIELAKSLRQRVHEITEQLEVIAPVYLVFTKADLIAGFVEFFEDADINERASVWGASLPYDGAEQTDALQRFDEHFERLYEGLKEMSVARMAQNRGQAMAPGLLTFPLEFQSIKPALRAFVATLFENNPFQFKPVFRGFYFTSALQHGASNSASSQRIAEQFGLALNRNPRAHVGSNHGFFLQNLFSKVIFADRNLVKQYASRTKLRLRYAGFFASALTLGLLLGGWSWSYFGNLRMSENVAADFAKITKLQANRIDLASRLEALTILQDRLVQLERYRADRPLTLGLGLYQGDALERRLRREYFAGMREVMLKPVAANIEAFLYDVNSQANELGKPLAVQAAAPAQSELYREASPRNVEDAYNALKTYIMLGDRERIDVGHLNDQITRFWRGWLENNRGTMPREQLIRSAEQLLGYYLAQAGAPDFPLLEPRLMLVDQSRQTLRRVVKGVPARERVYAEIKTRASTRYPAMTVAGIVGERDKNVIAGSYAIPGTFTRAAWEQYVAGAIREAATRELKTADWVLKTATHDDLTLEGSPEQIEKALVAMYKSEYIGHWQKFMQGIALPNIHGFDQAVAHMNRLGDPADSPLGKVMTTLYRETAWDNPAHGGPGLSKAQRGLAQWFRETILRQTPPLNVSIARDANAATGAAGGPVSREFAAVASIMMARGESRNATLMNGYLASLAKIRSRFNQINTGGDHGPASKRLMQQTLDGQSSELADALKYVDENMLNGMPDGSRATLRPLLVRPLMQAYAALVEPTQRELDKVWMAQVYNPFNTSLAAKYPFTPEARVEATRAEIAVTFGPEGSIAKFVERELGPLVLRRGETLSPRTWADMGVKLAPEFTDSFARYVEPLGGSANAAAEAQTVFQIQPLPTPGLTEYSIEIDGQLLRYRNGASEWTNFVWPNAQGQPGARVSAVGYDGRSTEIVNIPGRYGLERLISSAQRKRKDNGVFELSWGGGGATVAVNFRIISSAQSDAGGTPQNRGLRGVQLPAAITLASGS